MIGLDIPKHGEPAYPVESYGNGWEIPSEERKIPFPFYQTSITTFVNVIPTTNGTYKEPAIQHGQPGQANKGGGGGAGNYPGGFGGAGGKGIVIVRY